MKHSLSIFILGIFVSFCGGHSGSGGDGTNTGSAILNFANKKLIDVPVSLNIDNSTSKAALGASLGLTSNNSASSYSMTLTGCTSGQYGVVISSSVKVYPGDTGCLVKLTTYVFSGNSYSPKTGADFTNWLSGDTATFVNASNANDLFIVKVVSQLSQGGIASGDRVTYNFAQVTTGSSQNVNSNSLNQSQNVAVAGQEAPNFVFSTNGSPIATGSLAPIEFNGLNSSGIGQFVFNLYCNQAMGTSGICGSIPLASITYKLVGDVFGVHSGTSLSLSDLQNIMSSGTSSINTSTDILSDNNKGFKTSVLLGPGAISSNPYMIFVISGGTSFTYFSIQLGSVTNN